MDPKELKKLQEQLKKDQEQLKKDQEQLKKGQGQLKEGQGQLKEDRQALEAEKERLGPLAVIETEEGSEFDAKCLEGLVFRGRKEGKPLDKPGKKTKTKVFVPFERPMSEADVLGFRIMGTDVIIVTADGQKIKVKK